MTLSKKLAQAIRLSLYAAYAIAALLVAWGTYWDGWFQGPTSSGNTAADVLIGLIFATILAEPLGVFSRKASWREALKFGASWLAALIWLLLVGHLVSDTPAGMTLAVAPACGLFLAGIFYLARLGGTRIQFNTTIFGPSRAMQPASTLTFGTPPTGSLWGANSGGIDIAANRLVMLFRVILSIAIAALIGLATYRESFGRFVVIGIGLSIGYLIGQIGWILTGGNPILSMAADGLSIQRGVCGIRRLTWQDITSFELRAYVFYAFLVVHVRDAEALIDRQGPYVRWFMRQSMRTFGSPVRIPAGWLKCDRNWLLLQANQMLVTYGKPVSTAASRMESGSAQVDLE